MLTPEKKNIWQGVYEGFGYEIRNWNCGGETVWNYYVYIPLAGLSKETVKEVWLKHHKTKWGKQYRAYDSDILSKLNMHGGITYYSKYFSNRVDRGIKVGCDFSHLDDHYTEDDLDVVVADLKYCIDTIPVALKKPAINKLTKEKM